MNEASIVSAPASQPSERHAPAVAAAGVDALRQLRAATGPLHDRLDRNLPLARDGATLRDYARHLQAVGGWLQALAPAWLRPGADPSWAKRNAQRLRLIEADLRDCGLAFPTPPPATDDALPPSGPDSAAFAWGLAYVVEGSQLGGQMLHRALAHRLAPHPLRYLRGTGDAAAWHEFMTGLRVAVATPAQAQAATEGALAGFGTLVQRFEAAGDLPP
jgi:heme oxygenase